jgi:hypothetical protein
MSADNWAECPKCHGGPPGDETNNFREDWEIGLNVGWIGEEDQPPAILVKYRGECRDCGLLVELDQRHPVTWGPEKNTPSGQWRPEGWECIPAGWFIKVPSGEAWELVATENQGIIQAVTLRSPEGKQATSRRPAEQRVQACPGTAGNPIQGAVDALASSFTVGVLKDQVD